MEIFVMLPLLFAQPWMVPPDEPAATTAADPPTRKPPAKRVSGTASLVKCTNSGAPLRSPS
jgi:hypothetical protein